MLDMKIRTLFITGLLMILHFFIFGQASETDKSFQNGSYFNQKHPGKKAERFAEGMINYEPHNPPVFSPDGKEMIIKPMGDDHKYYKLINNKWNLQEGLPFNLPGLCNAIFLSPSGERAYFFIWENMNVFYGSSKKQQGWSELQVLSDELNAKRSTWQFTTAENENLYFSCDGNIMVSVFDGSKHSKPSGLKCENNNNLKGVTPYIAPDESYLIYSHGYDYEESDLYISYRLGNNKWTKPHNLGADINSKGNLDLCPIISPDAKVMFFLSRSRGNDFEIYWVDAGFIEQMKPKALK